MNSILLNLLFRLKHSYNRILSVFVDYHYDKKINPSISEDILVAYNKSRLKGPKEVLCYAPFKHMYFGFNGGVRACCINNSDLYGNISQMNVRQLWESESIRRLRKNILNYDLSGGCSHCSQQLRSHNFKAFEGRIYDSILPGTSSAYPTEMTFEISNTCNLECIMCNGTYSSSIRKNRDRLPPLEPAYDEHFIDSVKEALPHLKVARFMGGEPFLIPPYYDIIEYLIEHNRSCRIYIQTNGSIFNNRVKNILEKGNIRLSISIDSLEKENYERIRKNASFDRLMEHMKHFKKHSGHFGAPVNINFCVMTNNWKEVPQMITYCNKNHFTISLIPAETPQSLSIRYLSKDQLEEIHGYYSRFEKDLMAENRFNGEKFSDLIQFVKFRIEMKSAEFKRTETYLKEPPQNLIRIFEDFIKNESLEEKNQRFIFHLLELHVGELEETKKPLFLAALLSDMEENYKTRISSYASSPGWHAEMEAYFKMMKETYSDLIHNDPINKII